MERNAIARMMMAGGLIAMSTPMFAQSQAAETPKVSALTTETQPTRSPATSAQIDRLRGDIGTFEIVLQRSVDKAVMELNQWAAGILPNFQLFLATPPVARGVPAGEAAITFNVEVSEMIGGTLFQTMQSRQHQSPDPNVRVAQPSTVIQGDPLSGPPPTTPSAATTVSVQDHYSDLVRERMIDAILDQSGVLPLKDEQTLAVAVIPVNVTGPPSQSRTLILSIKGADLSQLRQGKISRDEAKRRIIETRF